MGFEPVAVRTEPLNADGYVALERVTFEVDGAEFTRDVVRHPGAVAVLAFDGRAVVLVRQWRAPLAHAILEVPAGTCDVPGEPLEATARRELEEEAGLAAEHVEPLCTVWNSPGWCDQETAVFLATGLTEVPRRPSGVEESAIEVVRLELGDAVALLDGDEALDSTLVLAIRTLAARLGP